MYDDVRWMHELKVGDTVLIRESRGLEKLIAALTPFVKTESEEAAHV